MQMFSVIFFALALPMCINAFSLTCQPPSNYARVMHIQDLGKGMETYLNVTSEALPEFTSWMNLVFGEMSVGLGTFTDKSVVTGFGEDYCWNLDCPFDNVTDTCINALAALSVIGDDTIETERSQKDAFFGASYSDWEVPIDRGRRIIFMYTDTVPRESSGLGLVEFPDDGTMMCNQYEYPTIAKVVEELLDEGIWVAVFTHPSNYAMYNTLFAPLGGQFGVFALQTDVTLMQEELVKALDYIYCSGVGTTTQPPTQTTEAPHTTDGPTCAETTILQLLHLQDMSWSYTNDLANMKLKFPLLLSELDNQFLERQVALGTFVDKPTAPVGYPATDYCYREHVNFTTDAALFMSELNSRTIRSGRDWKESQLDAIYYGAESQQLGWDLSLNRFAERVLRVVLLATDAGPHRKGDLPGQPGGSTCDMNDYPSFAEIQLLLGEKDIYPIFVVTSDIFNYWKNIMVSHLGNIGKVLRLADPVEDIIAEILLALEELCNESRLRV